MEPKLGLYSNEDKMIMKQKLILCEATRPKMCISPDEKEMSGL